MFIYYSFKNVTQHFRGSAERIESVYMLLQRQNDSGSIEVIRNS